MSLFSKQLYSVVQESYDDVEAYEIDDQVFECIGDSYLADAVTECSTGIMRTISALAITNLIESTGAVVEGSVGANLKAAKDKAVQFFKDLWKKIRAWFDKAIYNLKLRFTSAKQFYEKYHKDIETKFGVLPEFEVKSFRSYSLTAVSTFAKKIKELPTKVADAISDMEQEGSSDENYKTTTKADAVTTIIHKIGYPDTDNIADLKELLSKSLYNENGNSGERFKVKVAQMRPLLAQMKAYNDNIKAVQETRSNADKLLNAAIRTTMGVDDNATLEVVTNVYNAGTAVMNAMLPIMVKHINEVNSYAVAFFKKYLAASNSPKVKNQKPEKKNTTKIESAFDTIFDKF